MALISLVAAGAADAACPAKQAASPTSPDSPDSPGPSVTPAPEGPLYSMGDEIYTIDHDGTLYYDFRGNRDGSAKVKREVRYDRNLWNVCAQLQVRLPFVTRYPTAGNPYSGFGNAELGYSYGVRSPAFDHSLEGRAAFPTQSNGVEAIQTQIKTFYTTKWKWTGGSVSYMNEFNQAVSRSSLVRYASFYEGELVLPNSAFVDSPVLRGLRISAIYNGRVLFNRGGLYQSAIGGLLYGNLNDVALKLVDTWGIGPHGLWKYRVEATAAARF